MDNRQLYRTTLHKFYVKRYFDRYTELNGIQVAVCYYCDSIAYEGDHVPPLRCVRELVIAGMYEIFQIELLIVPACKSCNRKLSAKPLLTLEDRKKFIRSTTSKHYRVPKILNESSWHKRVYGAK